MNVNLQDIQVRNITPEDAQTILQLSQQLGYSISVEDTLANIHAIAAQESQIALAATLDGKIVGWVHAFEVRTLESLPFVELGGIVVDKDCRGLGIGKKLVACISQWCRERDIPFLRVRSQMKRKEAHQFYLHLGFAEIKEQKVFQINL